MKKYITVLIVFLLVQNTIAENWNISRTWDHVADHFFNVKVRDNIAYCTTTYGLALMDVSDPANPEIFHRIPFNGAGRGMELIDTLLYVLDTKAGMHIYNIVDPELPVEIGLCADLPSPIRLQIRDDLAYVANYRTGLGIVSIEDPYNPELISGLDVPGDCDDVALYENYTYIASGTGYLIDITDPFQPERVASFERFASDNIEIRGDHLFSGHFNVYAISNPFEPQITYQHGGSPGTYAGGFDFQENMIFIQNSIPREFSLLCYDISNLESPQLLGGCNPFGYTSGIDVEYEAGFVYLTYAENGFSICDMRNIEEAEQVGVFHNPANFKSVAYYDDYIYVADEHKAWIYIYSFADEAQPELIGHVGHDSTDLYYAHDFGPLLVEDGLLYSSQEYRYYEDDDDHERFEHDGFYVYSLDNPEEPEEIGHIRAISACQDMVIEDNIVYYISGGSSFCTINVEDPTNPEISNIYVTGRSTRGIDVQDNLMALAAQDTLSIYDKSNVEDLQIITKYTTQGRPRDVILVGDYAYLTYTDWERTLSVFSIVDPENPVEVYRTDELGTTSWKMDYKDGFILIAELYGKIEVYSLEDPERPQLAGNFNTPDYTQQAIFMNEMILVADKSNFGVYDASAIFNPWYFELSAESHDFRDVLVDNTASWTLTVTNRDDTPHNIEEMRLESDVFDCPFDDVVRLEPGDEANFEISFTPTEELDYSVTITIVSGDDERDILLSGSGIGHWLEDDPASGERFVVGMTWYDGQSNCNTGRMITTDENGSIHIVWMNGMEPDPRGERHVYYNYLVNDEPQFDGGCQIDNAVQAGYVNVDYNPETGVVPVFHSTDEQNLLQSFLATDNEPGAGEFNTTGIPNGDESVFAWPQVAIDRNGKAHILSSEYGSDEPFDDLAYRNGELNDEGEWEFDELEVIAQIASPSYIIASSQISDKVAVTYLSPIYSVDEWDIYRGRIRSRMNNDLFVVESQNGENFNWDNPVNITHFLRPNPDVNPESPLYQGDTLRCYSFVDACYDSDDNLHVIFSTVGLWEPMGEEGEFAGNTMQNLLWYWNRDSGEIHLLMNGWFEPGSNLSPWQSNLSYPSISATEDGKLYCVFTAFPPEGDRALNGFINGEIYATVSVNGGRNWATPTNLTNTHTPHSRSGEGRSESWCSLAGDIADNLHLSYILDLDPGSIPHGDGRPTNNPMIYHRVPRDVVAEDNLIEDRELHIEGGDLAIVTVSFQRGWNLISLNVSPLEHLWEREEGPDIIRMTDQLRINEESHHINLLKDEDGQFYSPGFNFNNIPYWDLTQGYLVNIDEAIRTIWYGEPIAPDADIPLDDGWNFAAYYPGYELDASAPDFYVLSSVIDNVVIAKDGDGRFLSTEFNFSNMPPWCESQGYQVRVDADVVLNYPLQREELASNPLPSKAERQNHWEESKPTGQNMSLLVTLNSIPGIHPAIGDQVAAFNSKDGLVGVGTVDASGRCGLAVWGDNDLTDAVDGLIKSESFTLKLWSSILNTEVDLEPDVSGLVYETDGFAIISATILPTIPDQYFLSQNYPNPFNSVTRIGYQLPVSSDLSIRVFDMSGREVATLVEGTQPAGFHSFNWDANTVAAGLYFVKMKSVEFSSVRKVVLIK